MIGSITTVISAIFWGLVVLSVLVFVHEGGHYLSARACGMRVTEFFLGMPCRYRLAWKSKTHGTVYGVTPILLGGYTRICGMEGEEDELLADCLAFVQERGRASAHDVAERLGVDEDRALDMLVTLSDWASIEPFYNPDKGEYEGQKDYPQEFRTLARDGHLRTEYDKGCDLTEEGSTQAGEPRAITLSASDFLAVERSQTYLGKGFWKRVVTLFAGPLVNVLVCIAIITVGLSAVGTDVAQNTNTLGVVDEGGYAYAAGVRVGDTITAVNNTAVVDWNSLASTLTQVMGEGKDFTLTVRRNGQELLLTVDLPEDQHVDVIGIQPQYKHVTLSVADAFATGVNYGRLVAQFAIRLIIPQHTMETLSTTSSVVGISAMAGQAAAAGAYELMLFVAMISMSLGIMNLLPIPPLDGGKILIELIQLIIRRPLPMKAQLAVSYLGLAFFMFIFVFALRNDIANFIMG